MFWQAIAVSNHSAGNALDLRRARAGSFAGAARAVGVKADKLFPSVLSAFYLVGWDWSSVWAGQSCWPAVAEPAPALDGSFLAHAPTVRVAFTSTQSVP
jgi:hypothetical protein